MAAVKVIMGKVQHNGKVYLPGQVVRGLDKDDHARVIKMKIGVMCSDDALDDEISEVTASTRTPYRGHVLTQEEKDNIDAEKLRRKVGTLEPAPAEKKSK
jgi:hypothetical protein